MASRSRSKSPRATALSRLKDILKSRVLEDDSSVSIWEFDYEDGRGKNHDDRAAALMTASILEQGLEESILSHLVELDDNERRDLFAEDKDSPLASFAARIRIGYALGIYGPKTRNDLTCIRHVRNILAHARKHIDFKTPEIVAACDQITLWERSEMAKLFSSDPHSARDRYVQTAKIFSIYLFSRDPSGPARYQDARPEDWQTVMS